MDYIVLNCTDTLALFNWGKDDHKLWIPLSQQGKAVLSGYAFVPVKQWPEMRRRCPSRFNVRVMAYDEVLRPKTVAVEELRLMQQFLNSEPRPIHKGDFVEILAGPHKGMIGSVLKVKAGVARILLGNYYINSPIMLLSPL